MAESEAAGGVPPYVTADDYRRAEELLVGAIDSHMHTAPDIFKRSVNDIEAAQQAKAAGMRAICVKNHVESTASRAALASQATGFPVYGGIALNHAHGGVNVHAADCAIRTGARVVWMPTWNAAQYLKHVDSVPMFKQMLPPGVQGLTLLDDAGNLLPRVRDVIALCRERDVVLATGHVSHREGFALMDEALRQGVRRLVITHASADFLDYTPADMKELGDRGVFIEHLWVFATHQAKHPVDPTMYTKVIAAVGPAMTVLATDGGQAINPPPVEMLKDFLATLCALGVPADDLRTMVQTNPARLLGL